MEGEVRRQRRGREVHVKEREGKTDTGGGGRKEEGKRRKDEEYNKNNAQVCTTKEDHGDQLLFHHEALQRTTCALYVKHTQSR